MAKQPVYHIDECESCSHRHVCKFLSKIDNLLKRGDLPLDLSQASCNEYLPEDVIDQGWKEYQEDYIEDSPLQVSMEDDFDPSEFMLDMNKAIADVMNKGMQVSGIAMGRGTMDMIKPIFNTNSDLTGILLVNGSRVPIRVDDSLEVGYFILDILC